MVNGDFYHHSSQTSGIAASGEFGLNKLIRLKGEISGSSSTKHYAYFYEHRTVAFQY